MSKTIVFLTSGTYGDAVQYVALGRGLQAAGERVVIATHSSFRALVEESGLAFAPLDGNPSDLIIHAGGQSALTFDGSWLRSAQATFQFWRAARPIYERLLASAWPACQDAQAEALVVGLPTTWGIHIAEALHIPCLWCCAQPISRTRAFPSAVLPSTFSLGPAYNWLTHLAAEQVLWQPWRAVINRWRRETLGLSAAPFAGVPAGDGLGRDQRRVLYGFSPQVVPRPPDWPAAHVITGYWFGEEPVSWTPPADLARFLASGPPPVYIGFGSPGTRQPVEAVDLIARALSRVGGRAVLAVPAGFPSGARRALPSHIFPIARAPHAWLFPRMAAVVHHGGARTVGTGLHAGVPSVILPLAVDQFFWGKRIAALGVGPAPIPQRALTVEKLAQAIAQATQDESIAARARALGQQIRLEAGLQCAVELIREWA